MKHLLLLGAALLAAAPLRAQETAPASAHWALTAADTTAVSATVGGIAALPVRAGALAVRSYTGLLTGDVPGPLGPFGRWWLGGDLWPVEGAPDAGRYVEFAVAPAPGATLQVDTFSLVLNAGGTGEMKANLFYDTSRDFAAPVLLAGDLALSRDTVARYAYALDAALGEGDTLYLRVYPWLGGGNASATRYLFVQDVTVSGMGAQVVAEPTRGVFWSLTSGDTTAVTAASDHLGGAPARGSTGLAVRDYTGTLEGGGSGPLGPFQRWWTGDLWPDESAPDGSRYAEFAAGAAPGYVFRADSLSGYVNGGGTGNMEAAIYYATDASFADSVALVARMPASRSSLGYFSVPLGIDVPQGDSLYVRVYPYLPGGSTSAGKYLFLQSITLAGEAVEAGAVGVEGEAGAPALALHPAYPNPVRDAATLGYTLAAAADVRVEVFNALGQRVAVLTPGAQAAGSHAVRVDASALAPGVYFVHLLAGGQSATQSFVVAR